MRLKLREFALVRDANGQLVEDGNNGGSGFKTAAKVGLGAAGVAGGAVLGTRYYHANKAVQEAGGWRKNWADLSKMSQAGNAQGMMDWSKNISANAQNSARQGWMGKLGKVGNVLTKFSANLKPALRELAARSGRIVEFGDDLEVRAKAAAESMYKGKAKARDVARSADWFMRHPEAIPGDESAVIGQLPSGGKTALMGAGIAGLGLMNHKLVKNDPSRFFRHLPKATMAGGLLLAGMGAERLRQERQRNKLWRESKRELSRFEFAQGQYVAGLLGIKDPVRILKTQRFFPTNGPVRDQIAQNARKIRGIDQVKGESLRKALQPKRDKLVKSTKDIYQKQKRGAVASMNSDSQDIQGWVGSQNYYSPLARKTKEVRAAYGLT
jgi:hypothetical protein